MNFGSVYGPATFIIFIHDMDAAWKALAKNCDIPISENTDMHIIANVIFSSTQTFMQALQYMECQIGLLPINEPLPESQEVLLLLFSI